MQRSNELAGHARVTALTDQVGGFGGGQQASTTGGINVRDNVYGTESGGRFDAHNKKTDASGRSQAIPIRLADYQKFIGRDTIITPEEFRTDKALQKDFEDWHWPDLKKYVQENFKDSIGTTIQGIEVTESGMIAVAHLGGKHGLQHFLESGGTDNPKDDEGTFLTDYLKTHAGLSTDFGDGGGDGSGPSLSTIYSVYSHPDTSAAQRKVLEEAFPQGFGGGGLDKNDELSGTTWKRVGDVMIEHGRTRNGKLVPYTFKDGTVNTKAIELKDIPLNASLDVRLKIKLEDIDDVDDGVYDAVKDEIRRLIRDEGMDEKEAERSALERMEFDQIELTDRRNKFSQYWGIGEFKEGFRNGRFLGSFRPFDKNFNATPLTRDVAPDATPQPEGFETPPAGFGAGEITTDVLPAVDPNAPPNTVNSAPASAAPNTPNVPSDPGGRERISQADQQTILMSARIAIAKGTSTRAKVETKLRRLGIDPSLLNKQHSPDEVAKIIAEAKLAISNGSSENSIRQALAALGIDPREAGL